MNTTQPSVSYIRSRSCVQPRPVDGTTVHVCVSSPFPDVSQHIPFLSIDALLLLMTLTSALLRLLPNVVLCRLGIFPSLLQALVAVRLLYWVYVLSLLLVPSTGRACRPVDGTVYPSRGRDRILLCTHVSSSPSSVVRPVGRLTCLPFLLPVTWATV